MNLQILNVGWTEIKLSHISVFAIGSPEKADELLVDVVQAPGPGVRIALRGHGLNSWVGGPISKLNTINMKSVFLLVRMSVTHWAIERR